MPPSQDGKTALDLAKRFNHAEVAAMLEVREGRGVGWWRGGWVWRRSCALDAVGAALPVRFSDAALTAFACTGGVQEAAREGGDPTRAREVMYATSAVRLPAVRAWRVGSIWGSEG